MFRGQTKSPKMKRSADDDHHEKGRKRSCWRLTRRQSSKLAIGKLRPAPPIQKSKEIVLCRIATSFGRGKTKSIGSV
jgi:hypothetical protein